MVLNLLLTIFLFHFYKNDCVSQSLHRHRSVVEVKPAQNRFTTSKSFFIR